MNIVFIDASPLFPHTSDVSDWFCESDLRCDNVKLTSFYDPQIILNPTLALFTPTPKSLIWFL